MAPTLKVCELLQTSENEDRNKLAKLRDVIYSHSYIVRHTKMALNQALLLLKICRDYPSIISSIILCKICLVHIYVKVSVQSYVDTCKCQGWSLQLQRITFTCRNNLWASPNHPSWHPSWLDHHSSA